MKLYLALFFVIILFSNNFSQVVISSGDKEKDSIYAQLFSYQPEKPIAGSEVKIFFSTKGTDLERSDTVYATMVYYSVAKQEMISLPMKKNGDMWELSIKIDKQYDVVGLKFESKDAEISNGTKGYYILTYDNKGVASLHSQLGKYAVMFNYGLYLSTGVNVDTTDERLIEQILTENPDLKKEYFYLLVKAAAKNKNNDNGRIDKYLEDFKKNYANTEEDYRALIYGYNMIKNSQKMNEISKEAIERFPNSSFAIGAEIKNVNAEKDEEKRYALVDQLLKKYPGDISVQRYLESLPRYYLKEKNIEKVKKFFDRYGAQVSSDLYSGVARALVNEGLSENYPYAEELAKRSVEMAEAELINPAEQKPEMTSDVSWYRKRKTTLIWNYISYANALYAGKKNEQALNVFDKMMTYMPVESFTNEQMISNYSALLVWAKRDAEAEKIIQHAIAEEKMTSEIKETLKIIYQNKYGNLDKYNELVATFEDKILERLKEEAKAKIKNDIAPDFTLKDLNGKDVSLSDYKGKIVILDFWATWCAPCLASFPGMQKAVDKFANDPDVVFLFVNTSEKGDDVEKKIKSLIDKKKYTFHILLDKEYKVRDAFNTKGIPNKFFIDKNGIIRIESTGFSGSADRLVDEITATISLLKEL
jgi:peroxiredoxin